METYPPWEKIRSPTELRKKYESTRNEIVNYKRTAQIANASTRSFAKDKEKYKKEAKVANKQLVQVTKKQKAADEANKSTMWSGAAAIAVTVLYETWKVVGFPGGRQWMDWWKHEAVYGIMMWTATIFFAQMYKMTKGR